MKKVIIVLALVALFAVPAFATVSWDPAVSASVNFAVDSTGIKPVAAGVYGKVSSYGSYGIPVFAKAGYVFSFDKDPAVSGVYVEVCAEKEFHPVVSEPAKYFFAVGAGVAADFHIVDGEFKVNVAPEVRVAAKDVLTFELPGENNPPTLDIDFNLAAKYYVLNNTGVSPFGLDLAGDFYIVEKQ